MKLVALVAAFSVSIPFAADARAAQASRRQRPAPPAVTSPEKVGEAYAQFLLGHRFEENEDETSAIAAYKRAMELDPNAAEIPAQLAGLYLKQSKVPEARANAEIALKVAPANREANRVLGTVYAALSDVTPDTAPARGRTAEKAVDDNLKKAVTYFELAIEGAVAESDPNTRATLARLYMRTETYEKAIPLLTDLVNQEAGWQDGPLMLVEAYAGAGRSADAIAWLEERTANDTRLLPALADFYERERRWSDAAAAYAKAVQRAPRNLDLKSRYASALMNSGGRANIEKARTALVELAAARPTDVQSLYLLSQAQRRLGDFKEAEAAARRIIAQNNRSPWGYSALADALESQRQYQSVADELAPVVVQNRGKAAEGFDIRILLPHLGFAYQEIGQFDKAIATFDEARTLSPDNPAIVGYLIEANIAAKKYAAAVDVAKAALAQNPNDLQLTRLEAQALRHSGKADQGIALLAEAVKQHAQDPLAYVSLARAYAESEQAAQAVNVLQDAQAKFPTNDGIAFELGTVLDKQKRFADAESAFRQVLTRDPENATALNYIGYMLAERGERLDESVTYLKRALVIEPDNASFLDSLGWAYFKADQLDLAETNLRRAADQLKANSVIQEHFGQVLFKLGRYDEAIAAWTRALAGDGDLIDKADVDNKIKAAKQKLPKK